MEDGEIGNWGTMYSARAEEDPDFMRCFQEGSAYQAGAGAFQCISVYDAEKENPEEENVKYILYHGQWKAGKINWTEHLSAG